MLAAGISKATAVVALGGMAAGLLGSASLIWTASSAALTDTTENGSNSFASGTVSLVDDDSGSVMFTAPNMVPGDTFTNCIAVDYTGSTFDVTAVKLYSTLDTNVDTFANHLDVVIEEGTGGVFDDCTGFSAASTEFTGTMASLASTHTSFANGSSGYTPASGSTGRVYRVTVTLGADTPNSAQGDSASVTLTWEVQSA